MALYLRGYGASVDRGRCRPRDRAAKVGQRLEGRPSWNMGKATSDGSQRRRAVRPLRGRRAGHAWKLTERESGEPRTGNANGSIVRAANPKSNAVMNGPRQSDRSVVPKKAVNKGGAEALPAESLEGTDLPKGNPQEQTNRWAQSRERLQQALERVRQAANACASEPEGRARFGKSARRDLCGGSPATGIPTVNQTICLGDSPSSPS